MSLKVSRSRCKAPRYVGIVCENHISLVINIDAQGNPYVPRYDVSCARHHCRVKWTTMRHVFFHLLQLIQPTTCFYILSPFPVLSSSLATPDRLLDFHAPQYCVIHLVTCASPLLLLGQYFPSSRLVLPAPDRSHAAKATMGTLCRGGCTRHPRYKKGKVCLIRGSRARIYPERRGEASRYSSHQQVPREATIDCREDTRKLRCL
ncbi:hypothetical protein F4818DRAFT_180927 [Hypoxylon cercidicola]|nr:hypothetical protein F4818DRAFT_180927 [Hypoxylon cercidicola]